jgi:hypothetical protein
MTPECTLFAAFVACALIGVWPVFREGGRLVLVAIAQWSHGR